MELYRLPGSELYHHGIKGQRWGVRRYQNYDGTRINNGDIIVRRNKTFTRYTPKKKQTNL